MHLNRGLHPSLLTALTLTVALSSLPAVAAAQDESQRGEDFAWQGQVTAGQTVEIRNINGPIHAEPSASGQVEVRAVKSGRRSDPRTVRIVTVPHAQGVTICALYPDVDGERNECLPSGGHHNSRDNDVKVEFWVKVPQGALFAARSVNGALDAKDLDARATLHTVNGSIDLRTMSYASAKTVNGSITARIGQADWDDGLELKTVNGSIELFLPAGTDADLQAKTVNGRINSELPLTVSEVSRRSVRGTIGAGGRGLTVETVNGSISLRSGGN